MAPKRSTGKSVASKGQTKNNNMVAAPVATNRSYQQKAQNQSIRIRETERIGTVLGSPSFAVVGNYPLNPGLSGSFPWLSATAAQYEKYKVHKITYRYKNLKGTASDGNILMAFDFDSLDSPPSSAVQMTQYTRCTDGSPWRIFEMSIVPTGTELFTRSSIPSGADLKTYDLGRLFVAAEGCVDDSAHGYLEVEYDIELMKKQSPLAGSSPPSTALATSYFNGSAVNTIGAFLGWDTAPVEVNNPLGVTVTLAGAYTVPAGSYLITVQYKPSGSGSLTFYKNGVSTGIFIAGTPGQCLSWTVFANFASSGQFQFFPSTANTSTQGQVIIHAV